MRNRLAGDGIRQRLRCKGLTLIELLVAISVLAFIAVMGWRGLDSIVRARIALAADLEQTRGMQLAFAQLQSDCAHLASAAVLPMRSPLLVGEGRITLVRTVFADNLPPSLQVITYRVGDGNLIRRESPATRDLTELDALWLAAVSGNETDAAQPDGLGTGVVLQSGVAALTMRLWVEGAWRAATDVSPAGANANITGPEGLEVVSQLQGREGRLLKVFLLGEV